MGAAPGLDSESGLPNTRAIRRVLVVDDSRLQRRLLTTMLRRRGYEVREADNALVGLAVCRQFQPDLVLSDWVMPGIDGLEFCRRFRALDRESYGYFILLTSKSEKDEMVRGLDAGADDFLVKPVGPDELRARINAGERILGMERELHAKTAVISDTLAELRGLYDAIDRDLQQARVIQQSLIPERTGTFGGSRVSLLLESCGHVGGDLVGMLGPENGKFGLYSLDVSGHGITSAMITARVAGYLSQAYPEESLAFSRQGNGFALRAPEDTASLINQRMTRQQGLGEYLTLAYACVDMASGMTRITQAGHPPPLLIRADGTMDFVGAGGFPVGLIEGAQYEGYDVHLRPGDRLLLYSDGLTEACRRDGAMLGEEGLAELLRAGPVSLEGTTLLDGLYEKLCEVTGKRRDFDDDVSAALLEYGGS